MHAVIKALILCQYNTLIRLFNGMFHYYKPMHIFWSTLSNSNSASINILEGLYHIVCKTIFYELIVGLMKELYCHVLVIQPLLMMISESNEKIGHSIFGSPFVALVPYY
ncbi:hypothetical protein ACJX0J_023321 [Zea mays]